MASHAKRFDIKNGELFRRMLDEKTTGLPSLGFLDADTGSLGSDVTLDERDRDPNVINDFQSRTQRQQGKSHQLILVRLFAIYQTICFCCKPVCVLTVL